MTSPWRIDYSRSRHRSMTCNLMAQFISVEMRPRREKNHGAVAELCRTLSCSDGELTALLVGLWIANSSWIYLLTCEIRY